MRASGSMSPERSLSTTFKEVTVIDRCDCTECLSVPLEHDRYHSFDDLRLLQSACGSRRSPTRLASRRSKRHQYEGYSRDNTVFNEPNNAILDESKLKSERSLT